MIQTENISIDYCDFCEGQYRQPIKFRKVYDKWESSSWYEPLDPLTGSDWIANWCAHCGPKHRSERAYRDWLDKKAEYVFGK